MTGKRKRFAMLICGIGSLFIVVLLMVLALSESITYFYTPSDLITKMPLHVFRIRIGGKVVYTTLLRNDDDIISFDITDGHHTIAINYSGVLPDLFREGQNIVAEGYFPSDSSIFLADVVLAKHDEVYMSKETSDKLKRNISGKVEEN